MPDELQGGGQTNTGGGPAAPAAAAAPAPALGATATANTSVDGGEGSGAVPGSTQPGTAGLTKPATPDIPGVRDVARQLGLADIAQVPDDHTALQQMALAYQQWRQAQPMLPYAQQYMQHAAEFQQWQRQRQEETARQPQQSWWKAPEYDPRWEQLVVRDPQTGELRPAPGAPPDIVQRLAQARDHQRDFLSRFAHNPIEAIKPGLEEVARSVAQQMVQEHLGGYQAQVAAQSIVRENASWLHQRDEQGRPVLDPLSGQPALTPEGQLYRTYVLDASNRLGIRDVQAQHQYALGLLQRDVAVSRLQQAQGAAAGQQQNQQVLQQAAAAAAVRPNAGGAIQPPDANGRGAPTTTKIPLAQRLRQAVKNGGFALQED